jgi:hypothetical protein
MKNLLYLFSIIGFMSLVISSCQPASATVTCDCTGSGNGVGTVTVSGGLTLIDTNLIGHWKNANPLVNLGTSFNSQYMTPTDELDIYFSPDNFVYISHSITETLNNNSYDVSSGPISYKVLDEGIMCFGNNVIHYEINNGIFTYYKEDGIPFSFQCYTVFNNNSFPFAFDVEQTSASGWSYFVQDNALQKQ